MHSTVLQKSETKPSNAIASLAAFNKALADPLRLTILRLLMDDSFAVLELSQVLNIRQSALSHHLKILANAHLVDRRREGNSIFYRRAFIGEGHPYRELKTCVFEQIDALPISSGIAQAIKRLQLERSQLSLSFFNRNAGKFREKQGLIVAHEEYSRTLHEVIDSLPLPEQPQVLEVGPGEGQMLTELAARFSHLTAVDNSNDMLKRSEKALESAGFEHVEFILGDTSIACSKKIRNDLILIEMVLHHISSPAETFKDCCELLNAQGFLLLVDLAPHGQDWVRDSCGDLWLGFEKQELDRWAERAGLKVEQASYLQLRNGFQIQIRVFKKLVSNNLTSLNVPS